MKITFKARLKAGIKYDKEAEVYIAYTPALRLYSQGETPRQAKMAIKDAVGSFLIVSYTRGVLEKCLKSAGFSAEDHTKAGLSADEEYIRIKEEAILKENKFKDIFDVPASLPLSRATV